MSLLSFNCQFRKLTGESSREMRSPHAEFIVKKIPLLDCFQDDFFQAFGDLN